MLKGRTKVGRLICAREDGWATVGETKGLDGWMNRRKKRREEEVVVG
jgi:hypothetical protein